MRTLGETLQTLATTATLLGAAALPAAPAHAADDALVVRVDDKPKPISPDLFGIFFEDINYSADGGLYAELVQNRSFEYQATEQITWNNASFWDFQTRGGGRGAWFIDAARPLHANNPHYAVIEIGQAGDGVGLANGGFDGIAVKAGATYDVSLFARQLYMNDRWGPGSAVNGPMPLTVRLERKDGAVLGEVKLKADGTDWNRLTGQIVAREADPAARLVVLANARGGVALDEISLFPHDTFKNRPNGLRADLAQTIADLHPKFIRFPGGCLVHGSGTNNFYRWKDTIGPIEQRRGQSNIWGYHQSVGLGYFEYFQFCEDIGARPLPVVAAGVSCQNSGHRSGTGQQCVPMEDMPAYIQDVLDLVEWANGPETSTWGAKRAAAGHPKPFGLKYLGVGNEDHITPEFEARFKMIFDAVKAKYPDVTVVGTVGPSPAGEDYEAGWKIANQLNVPVVDEHYYESPNWFWDNLTRYDAYDRKKSAVYLGEYAAHDGGRRSTLRSALAEAAYMTSLERNGDVVHLASYAPLLGKLGRLQWSPDLIYFDNSRVFPTVNYQVQKLFGVHAGDTTLPVTLPDWTGKTMAASCVRDNKTGRTVLKIVSRSDTPLATRLDLSALKLPAKAQRITLAGHADDENAPNAPAKVLPKTATLDTPGSFPLTLPPQSLTVLVWSAEAGNE